MTFDQDKRESDFLKRQRDPDSVRDKIPEQKRSVNREENDEKI